MAFRLSAQRHFKKLKSLKNLLPFGKPIAVKRSSAPYIEKTGWRETGTMPAEWHGYYRTRFGSYKGRITASTPPQYYIYQPPEGLTTKHTHKNCFYLMRDNWCSVHFKIQPRDLDSGVIKLERILCEAYLLTHKTA
jgi:hypothetical protein